MAHRLTFIQYIEGMHFDEYEKLNNIYRSHSGLILAVNSECFKAAQELSEEERSEVEKTVPRFMNH